MESSETGRGSLGGEFSAADVMMGYVVDVAERRGDLAVLPRLGSYVERLRARPAYRRAQEIGAAGASS